MLLKLVYFLVPDQIKMVLENHACLKPVASSGIISSLGNGTRTAKLSVTVTHEFGAKMHYGNEIREALHALHESAGSAELTL